MKVVLFGDSLLAQVGKHRVLMLEDKIPGADVYNCAVGGWDTNDCAKKAPYTAKLQPDILVLSVGTNDASPWKQVELSKFKANLPEIFQAFDGSKIIYFLPPPGDEQLHSDNKKRPNTLMKEYYDAAKTICVRHNIATVNSWDIFLPLLEKGHKYHTDDGTHLEDKAYDIVFNEVSKLVG